jgi:signal transduction histidine kinase
MVRDLLMVVVAFVVSLLVSRQVGRILVNRPIEALSHAVSRLSCGDLDARTGIETRNDEIGLLATAFDGMVEVLASRDLQQRELRRKAQIDAALAKLYPVLVSSGETFDAMAREILDQAIGLTGSSAAFISIIDPVTRWARSIAVLEAGHDSANCRTRKSIFLEPGMDGEYSGLRGHALNTGVPFFTNEYLSHPGASRIPTGHFAITRFLSVPVLLEGKVAGQIALANPAADYTEHDVDAVIRLAEPYAFAIQRLRSEESIGEYQRQLKSMITESTLTQERERRQIASILHDELGQSLALAKIKLGVLESGSAPDDCRSLADIRKIVSDAIEISRSLTFEISPPVLYQVGLVAALESLAETFRKCHGLPVVFRQEADSAQLSEEINILLYHSTRELLMNVLKHAEATSVRLACRQKTDEIMISVSDDGNGMPLTAQVMDGHGFGLFSIRERLCHLNGKMSIESAPVSGTTVTIQVPLNPAV